MSNSDTEVMHRDPAATPHLGILAEDLQGALTAASRIQQRGVTVEVLKQGEHPTGTPHVVVYDLNLRGTTADPAELTAEGTRSLQALGCRRLELRFDTLLRGVPREAAAGFLGAFDDPDALVAVVPAYPAAGRACIDGVLHVPSSVGVEADIDVAEGILPGRERVVITVGELTEGVDATMSAIAHAHEGGVRVVVFDGTTEGHLAVAAEAVERFALKHTVLTLSSGAWLRFYPDMDFDGYMVVVASGANKLDTLQLRRVADVYGSQAKIIAAGDLQTMSERYIHQLLARHSVFVIQGNSAPNADAWIVAADLAAATRRLLDVSLAAKNPCLGVITSGGVTTGTVVRSLDADRLEPGNELEPLCPVTRLGGGPFPHLAVISKASGVGTPETLVRLIRRVIGT